MNAPWTTPDIAQALGISRRACEDLLRDPEAPDVPYFGKVGNSRLFDPLLVKSMLPALRAYIADGPERSRLRQEVTLKQQAEALAAKRAKFERECREHEERMAHFRQCERDNADEQDGRATRRGSTAILPSPGSR